ncbi:MAG: hypothetical protein AAF589_03395 [Planctomycetota bacterium]
MDARFVGRVAFCVATVAASLANVSDVSGATYRTANFVIEAPTAALANEIGLSAERWRKQLAEEWLGKPMPAWTKPCPVRARVAPHLGAGGETSFVFDQGEVFGWDMKVQGSRERVLDSVLPHEITHTVFASHFRQPLPRWADEGACTTVEHASEIGKQERMLIRFLKTGRGIPFSDLFAMKEYPPEVMPLYSQGHSLATFLIERRGKRAFMEFLADGMTDENWPAAVRDHYGHDSLHQLQDQWLAWVKQGRPRLTLESDVTAIASAPQPTPTTPSAAVATAPQPPAGSVYASLGPAERPASNTARAASVYDASRNDSGLIRR